jgi:hypothetical protein
MRHQTHGSIPEPALELPTRQACPLKHFPLLVGDGQLEDALGKVNGNSSSIHIGLPRSGFS